MSELAHVPHRARPLAWGQAARWGAIMAIGYGSAILCARIVVTARLGGDVFTPFTMRLLLTALATAVITTPVLAIAARDPASARFIRLGLQWGAISVLALGLALASGAAWNDTTLEILARYVAGDVQGLSSIQGVH